MEDTSTRVIRKALILVNYMSLAALLVFYKLAVTLRWNATLVVMEVVLLAIIVFTFYRVHIRTGFWKLVHTRNEKLDESDIRLTRRALAFALTWFTVICLFVFYYKIKVLRGSISALEIAAMVYLADTLPSSFISWKGESSVLAKKALKRWVKRIVIAFAVIFFLFVINITLIRPWQHNWGATSEEVNRPMPGDELVADPDMNATRAVSVQASPEDIWPWIVQLGYKRGGFYSFDYFDNDGIPSASRIIPEYQNLKAGDKIPLGESESVCIRVISMELNTSLVWQFEKGPWGGNTWDWGLYPQGSNHTRLVSRLRATYDWEYPNFMPWFFIDTFEILMMRKCLLGIKLRAEALASLSADGTD